MLAHLLVISSIISSALTTRYHRSLLERGIYTVDNAIGIPSAYQLVQQLDKFILRNNLRLQSWTKLLRKLYTWGTFF